MGFREECQDQTSGKVGTRGGGSESSDKLMVEVEHVDWTAETPQRTLVLLHQNQTFQVLNIVKFVIKC